jgi:hypothetical protein
MVADSDIDSVVEWLRGHDADLIEHPGGSLLDHLLRVHAKLRGWRLDHDVCLAGMCHAAYGTDGFPSALLSVEARPFLAELIGQRAEHLAYMYGSCDRRLTYATLRSPGSDIVMVDRFTGGHSVPVVGDLEAFCHITVANELDVLVHSSRQSTILVEWMRQMSSDMSLWLNENAVMDCQLTLDGWQLTADWRHGPGR